MKVGRINFNPGCPSYPKYQETLVLEVIRAAKSLVRLECVEHLSEATRLAKAIERLERNAD